MRLNLSHEIESTKKKETKRKEKGIRNKKVSYSV